jgi:hypothetical protein
VLQLVGAEADLDLLEPREAVHDLPRGDALLVPGVLGGDEFPVFGGPVAHVGEHGPVRTI